MSNGEKKTRPAHEVKCGLIRATIWPNETKDGLRYNVTLSRLYKDGDAWKSTGSFGERDLFDVVRASVAAFNWIRDAQGEKAGAAGATRATGATAAA
jgi:hypothetical protein